MYKRLPIPSLCISNSDEKYEAIDGQQRISSIFRFLDVENEWKLATLEDISPELSGKTNSEIKTNESKIFDRIQNTTLPINMVTCDISKKEHLEYIIQIFARLNTGGMQLEPQEIRNCVFLGKFMNKINELAENTDFKKLVKNKTNTSSDRQEMVLTFFATYDAIKHLSARLKTFLDQYMLNNRNMLDEDIAIKKSLFLRAVSVALKIKDLNSSKSYLFLVLYGISKNPNLNVGAIQEKYNTLMKNELFEPNQFKGGVWARNKVEARFNKAQEIFA